MPDEIIASWFKFCTYVQKTDTNVLILGSEDVRKKPR